MDFLIPLHGGTLCRQLADPGSVERLKEEARATRAVVLSPRQISDLDLLLNGGFSPLRGFLGRADYESVLDAMRLESGLLWPIPVTLDIPDAIAEGRAGDRLALQDPEGFTRALRLREPSGTAPRNCAGSLPA
jgi:sulfate adenylyltransferase